MKKLFSRRAKGSTELDQVPTSTATSKASMSRTSSEQHLKQVTLPSDETREPIPVTKPQVRMIEMKDGSVTFRYRVPSEMIGTQIYAWLEFDEVIEAFANPAYIAEDPFGRGEITQTKDQRVAQKLFRENAAMLDAEVGKYPRESQTLYVNQNGQYKLGRKPEFQEIKLSNFQSHDTTAPRSSYCLSEFIQVELVPNTAELSPSQFPLFFPKGKQADQEVEDAIDGSGARLPWTRVKIQNDPFDNDSIPNPDPAVVSAASSGPIVFPKIAAEKKIHFCFCFGLHHYTDEIGHLRNVVDTIAEQMHPKFVSEAAYAIEYEKELNRRKKEAARYYPVHYYKPPSYDEYYESNLTEVEKFVEIQKLKSRFIIFDGNKEECCKSVVLTTKKWKWMKILESAELEHLIPMLQENRLTSLESWNEMISDPELCVKLHIDSETTTQMQLILSENGFVTKAEKSRMDAEKAKMDHEIQKMLSVVQSSNFTTQFSMGTPVKVKTGSSTGSEDHNRSGIVVNGGSKKHALVRFEGEKEPVSIAVEKLEKDPFLLFMSHVQAEGQDQVSNLCLLLKQKGARAWYDMESERLELEDMLLGVANSKFFCIYLTKSYFTRYWTMLEARFAKALGIPLVVVAETDPRHGGNLNTMTLVDQATRYHPEFKTWILEREIIPMARRAFHRNATVSEILTQTGFGNRNGKPVASMVRSKQVLDMYSAAIGNANPSQKRASYRKPRRKSGQQPDPQELLLELLTEQQRLIQAQAREIESLVSSNAALWSSNDQLEARILALEES